MTSTTAQSGLSFGMFRPGFLISFNLCLFVYVCECICMCVHTCACMCTCAKKHLLGWRMMSFRSHFSPFSVHIQGIALRPLETSTSLPVTSRGPVYLFIRCPITASPILMLNSNSSEHGLCFFCSEKDTASLCPSDPDR